MTLNREFTDDPLGFANQYAIIPDRHLSETLRDGNGQKVTLAGFSFVQDISGVQVGGYAKKAVCLERDDAGFPCYWLSYEENKSKRCVIGTDAAYMFTFTMDGCSFGVGSKTGTGELLVAHANALQFGADSETQAQGDTATKLAIGRAAQASRQLQMLKKKMNLNRPVTALGPGDYTADLGFMENLAGNLAAKVDLIDSWVDADQILKKSAVTFGVRDKTTWTFYAQRRVMTVRGHIVLRDVIKIATV